MCSAPARVVKGQRVPPGSVPGGTLGDVPPSPQKGGQPGAGGGRAQRGHSGPGTLRLPPRPGTSDGASPADPGRALSSRGGAALTAGSCRSCAGYSARAACARTAWLQLRARRAPGVAAKQLRSALTSPAPLEAALTTGGAASPAHLWTARGRSHGRTRPPQAARRGGGLRRLRTWLTRSGLPFPGASAPRGCGTGGGGAAADRG